MQLDIRKQDPGDLGRLSILFYGMAKVGKTSEAAKFPNPLILECEPRGAQFVSGVDVLAVDSLDFLEKAMPDILKTQYKTLILDGFTWMLEQAVKASTASDPRQAYKKIGDRFAKLLGIILNSDKIVIATGHSRKVDDDEVAGKVEIRPDVNPDLSDSIFGVFSIICYCYPTPDGSKMLTKPDETPKRRILAGDRSGKLPKMMKLSATDLLAELRKGVQVSPIQPEATIPPTNGQPEPPPPPTTNGHAVRLGQITEGQSGTLHALGVAVYGDAWDNERHRLVRTVTNKRTASSKELSQSEADTLIGGMEKKCRTAYAELAEQISAAVGGLDPSTLAEIDQLAGVELAAAHRVLVKMQPVAEAVEASLVDTF